jgi:hypothetical protein
MSRLIRSLITIALLGTTPALGYAQSAERPSAYPRHQVNVPFSSRSVGIPGPEHLCVKACEFDLNPCDPPVFKHADGRCSG